VDAVVGQRGRPIVLINATEGEPPSRKDHVLLRGAPHLVIDGAIVCAAMVGAREAIVAVEASSQREHAVLDKALAERDSRRTDDRVKISLGIVPDGFVVGEERALINALNGGPGKPTFAPPRPFQKGINGAPTLVQNAETAAQLALIARHGADWFRALGTPAEPGSALVTLTGAVTHPGVYEIPLGTALEDLLAAAGGLSARVQAYLVGGYFGTWLDAADADGLRLSNADLAEHGGGLGARAIVALPATACGLAETARVARYLSDESAGQCGPCVHGLDAIAGGLERIARGDGRALPDIERWLGLVVGRGACRHPDGAAKLIASALDVFADELRRHTIDRKCSGDGTAVLPVPRRAAVRRVT
jgi:NADH:ubiquinone oxidoreductase subunit F (NADH-binding)